MSSSIDTPTLPPIDSPSYTTALESALESLPILTRLRSAPDADEWYESRPFANSPEEKRMNTLTGGALKGPGKLALQPFVRARKDESASVVIVHVGKGLCGYEGIAHGGLLATVLDEALGRQAIINAPERIAMTANLSMDYKAPARADQFLIIHTKLVEINGRKISVEGRMEDLNGLILVQAKALFIQPKWSNLLNGSEIKAAMKDPQHTSQHDSTPSAT